MEPSAAAFNAASSTRQPEAEIGVQSKRRALLAGTGKRVSSSCHVPTDSPCLRGSNREYVPRLWGEVLGVAATAASAGVRIPRRPTLTGSGGPFSESWSQGQSESLRMRESVAKHPVTGKAPEPAMTTVPCDYARVQARHRTWRGSRRDGVRGVCVRRGHKAGEAFRADCGRRRPANGPGEKRCSCRPGGDAQGQS